MLADQVVVANTALSCDDDDNPVPSQKGAASRKRGGMLKKTMDAMRKVKNKVKNGKKKSQMELFDSYSSSFEFETELDGGNDVSDDETAPMEKSIELVDAVRPHGGSPRKTSTSHGKPSTLTTRASSMGSMDSIKSSSRLNSSNQLHRSQDHSLDSSRLSRTKGHRSGGQESPNVRRGPNLMKVPASYENTTAVAAMDLGVEHTVPIPPLNSPSAISTPNARKASSRRRPGNKSPHQKRSPRGTGTAVDDSKEPERQKRGPSPRKMPPFLSKQSSAPTLNGCNSPIRSRPSDPVMRSTTALELSSQSIGLREATDKGEVASGENDGSLKRLSQLFGTDSGLGNYLAKIQDQKQNGQASQDNQNMTKAKNYSPSSALLSPLTQSLQGGGGGGGAPSGFMVPPQKSIPSTKSHSATSRDISSHDGIGKDGKGPNRIKRLLSLSRSNHKKKDSANDTEPNSNTTTNEVPSQEYHTLLAPTIREEPKLTNSSRPRRTIEVSDDSDDSPEIPLKKSTSLFEIRRMMDECRATNNGPAQRNARRTTRGVQQRRVPPSTTPGTNGTEPLNDSYSQTNQSMIPGPPLGGNHTSPSVSRRRRTTRQSSDKTLEKDVAQDATKNKDTRQSTEADSNAQTPPLFHRKRRASRRASTGSTYTGDVRGAERSPHRMKGDEDGKHQIATSEHSANTAQQRRRRGVRRQHGDVSAHRSTTTKGNTAATAPTNSSGTAITTTPALTTTSAPTATTVSTSSEDVKDTDNNLKDAKRAEPNSSAHRRKNSKSSLESFLSATTKNSSSGNADRNDTTGLPDGGECGSSEIATAITLTTVTTTGATAPAPIPSPAPSPSPAASTQQTAPFATRRPRPSYRKGRTSLDKSPSKYNTTSGNTLRNQLKVQNGETTSTPLLALPLTPPPPSLHHDSQNAKDPVTSKNTEISDKCGPTSTTATDSQHDVVNPTKDRTDERKPPAAVGDDNEREEDDEDRVAELKKNNLSLRASLERDDGRSQRKQLSYDDYSMSTDGGSEMIVKGQISFSCIKPSQQLSAPQLIISPLQTKASSLEVKNV